MRLLIWLAVCLCVAATAPSVPVEGHERNYVATSVGSIECVDAKTVATLLPNMFPPGIFQAIMFVADPLLPDPNGSCYRQNHIAPSAAGDVTFTVKDVVRGPVGLCVSQDGDDDGRLCDEHEVHARGCGSTTVNVDEPVPNAWRFQDAPGAPARTTWVVVNGLVQGGSVLGPVQPDCGAGQDAFGLLGTIDHS